MLKAKSPITSVPCKGLSLRTTGPRTRSIARKNTCTCCAASHTTVWNPKKSLRRSSVTSGNSRYSDLTGSSSRTPQEIRRRCTTLLTMISKEDAGAASAVDDDEEKLLRLHRPRARGRFASECRLTKFVDNFQKRAIETARASTPAASGKRAAKKTEV